MAEKSENSSAKKPWFKRKRIMIPLGFFVILGIASAGGGSSSSTSDSTSSTTESAAPAADKPGIGTEVKDGKFAFTITSVKCGIAKVGSGTFSAKAQGQYCVVAMNVANIGKEPQTIFSSNQKAFDTQGREFSNDTTAEIYAPDTQTWLKEINPGNALSGTVYFDVPKDATLDYIELHDSAFSGGVKVYLS
jgi:hypothetical protein